MALDALEGALQGLPVLLGRDGLGQRQVHVIAGALALPGLVAEAREVGIGEGRRTVDRHRQHVVALIEDVLLARSEEHTSELQSLMRSSYAVLCLKKKKSKIIYII